MLAAPRFTLFSSGRCSLLLLLLGALLALLPQPMQGLHRADLVLNPDTNFTLIYGSADAKMNFSQASDYCATLSGSVALLEGEAVRAQLASIHDYYVMRRVMEFILKHDKHRVYLGGTVTKQIKDDNTLLYEARWADGTEMNFDYLHQPNEVIQAMPERRAHCIAIDYVTGQWGVHNCSDRLYFLCEVKITAPDSMKVQPPPPPPSAPQQPSGAAAGGEAVGVPISRRGGGDASGSAFHHVIFGSNIPVDGHRVVMNRRKEDGFVQPKPEPRQHEFQSGVF